MRIRIYIVLFIAGFILNLLIVDIQKVPSYMDSAYYYANGVQMVSGKGFTEPFIWNYLDDPSGLPHPSHIYWMPMASLLSALGMLLSGKSDFFSARMPFIFLSGILSPLTAFFAFRLRSIPMGIEKKYSYIWLAGLLAIFSGFYALYSTATDSFSVYMILGSLFIMLSGIEGNHPNWRFFALGSIAGLMHLSRADGIIWAAAALVLGAVYLYLKRHNGTGIKYWFTIVAVFLGYGLIMSPWYIRNAQLFGNLFPPGGSRTLWLLNYDQIYSYPSTTLSFDNWWRAGLGFHLQTWLDALGKNLKSVLGVQGLVLLMPLILVGLWRLRHDPRVQFGTAMWVVTFGVMTLVFPFPGSRGGYLHSSAAIQPFLWAVTGYGLDGFILAGVRWRKWNFEQARRIFSISVIVISMLITIMLFFQRQIGTDIGHPAYRGSWDKYVGIETALISYGIEDEQAVLINNPPMYFAATGRPAYVVPDGDVDALMAVANRYHLHWLVLEKDNVSGLSNLYRYPDHDGLVYLGNVGENEFFYIGEGL